MPHAHPNKPLRGILILSMLLWLSRAGAQTLTWNGGNDGDWNLVTANWLDADDNPVTWVQGADALIVSGNIGGNDVDPVSTGIQVNNLTFTATNGGELDLNGGTLQVAGTILQSGTEKIHFRTTNLTGSGTVQFTGSLAGESFLVRSANAFNGTLRLGGTGHMQLEGSFASPLLEFTSANNTLRLRSGTKTFSGIIGSSAGNAINSSSTDTTLAVNVGTGNSYTFAGNLGQVSNILSLTKLGEGTQSFTGTMSFTGATTVTGGVLSVGDGGTTGSLSASSAVTVNALGVLAFNRSNAMSVGNTINGAGWLRQAGAGTTTLTGSIGATTQGNAAVTAGTLELAGAGDKDFNTVQVSGGAFLHSAGTWSADIFHVNGSGAGSISMADLAHHDGTASTINYTLDLGGVSTIQLSDANPFGQYVSASDWATQWHLAFDTIAGLGNGDFTDLPLLAASGYDLTELDGILRMRTWDEEGSNPTIAPVTHGQTVYLLGDGAVGTYTVSFSEGSLDLVFSSSRAIPEPGTLGLALAGLLVLRHRIRRRDP